MGAERQGPHRPHGTVRPLPCALARESAGSASASPRVGSRSPVRRSTIAVSSCSRSAMPARTSAPNAPRPAPSSRSPSARLAPMPGGGEALRPRPAPGGRCRRPPRCRARARTAASCGALPTGAAGGLPASLPAAPGLDGLVQAVGERGGPDERAAERGGEERGQHGHVAGDRARARGDAVHPVELGVDLAQGDLGVVEQRARCPRGPCGWRWWPRRACDRA